MQTIYLDFNEPPPVVKSREQEVCDILAAWSNAINQEVMQNMMKHYMEHNPWTDLAKGMEPPDWKPGQSTQLQDYIDPQSPEAKGSW